MSDATSQLLQALGADPRIYDLAQPWENGMPSSPNHPGFRMSLQRRHGDMVRADGSSAANELIVTGGHVGTHVDALAHVSYQGKLFGGIDANEAQRGGRFKQLGIDTMLPIVGRGVLLDVAAARGVSRLAPGYGITALDLELAAKHADVELRSGDSVLVRTGWSQLFSDGPAYLGSDSGVPGVTEEAATWLAGFGISVTGSDTTAYEQIPAGKGHALLPVHRVLLVEHGIHIIEHLDLETLATAQAAEFLFICSPLKIVGGTGSPVRPLAVVPQ